jgi:hypothetical protein
VEGSTQTAQQQEAARRQQVRQERE